MNTFVSAAMLGSIATILVITLNFGSIPVPEIDANGPHADSKGRATLSARDLALSLPEEIKRSLSSVGIDCADSPCFAGDTTAFLYARPSADDGDSIGDYTLTKANNGTTGDVEAGLPWKTQLSCGDIATAAGTGTRAAASSGGPGDWSVFTLRANRTYMVLSKAYTRFTGSSAAADRDGQGIMVLADSSGNVVANQSTASNKGAGLQFPTAPSGFHIIKVGTTDETYRFDMVGINNEIGDPVTPKHHDLVDFDNTHVFVMEMNRAWGWRTTQLQGFNLDDVTGQVTRTTKKVLWLVDPSINTPISNYGIVANGIQVDCGGLYRISYNGVFNVPQAGGVAQVQFSPVSWDGTTSTFLGRGNTCTNRMVSGQWLGAASINFLANLSANDVLELRVNTIGASNADVDIECMSLEMQYMGPKSQ